MAENFGIFYFYFYSWLFLVIPFFRLFPYLLGDVIIPKKRYYCVLCSIQQTKSLFYHSAFKISLSFPFRFENRFVPGKQVDEKLLFNSTWQIRMLKKRKKKIRAAQPHKHRSTLM